MPEVVPEVLTELQHDVHTHARAHIRTHMPACLPTLPPPGNPLRHFVAAQVVPVFNYRRVDLLMRVWDNLQVRGVTPRQYKL